MSSSKSAEDAPEMRQSGATLRARVNERDLERFRLGFAPDEWAHLSVSLQKQGRAHQGARLGLITERMVGFTTGSNRLRSVDIRNHRFWGILHP